MKSLIEVESFGAVDADKDDFLYECFEDHEAFIELLKFKKFLIVGRKGSGKTAIFKKLLKIREHDVFTIGHTFSDYPWHYHDKQARVGVPAYDKFTHSWKYLILLTLAKIILNKDQSLPYDDESMDLTAKIENFVIDTYGTRDVDITQIFTPAKKLRIKPNIKVDADMVSAGVSLESIPMEMLPTIIQEVNSNLLAYVLRSLNPNNKYYVCFDQLDLGFNPEDPEYSNRLISLILACRDINTSARENGKKVMVALFLRDDIYDILHFEDKNKITENYLSMIEWDTLRTTKTLKGLMEKRFSKLLGTNEFPSVAWEDVFDETQEMTGHQKKYQHIIDRTYLRPRDIIKFCNVVLSQYKDRKSSDNGVTNEKFNNVDINKAKTNYSDYMLKELDDEIHKHIPEYKDYLEILKSIGVAQFSKEEFEGAFAYKKTVPEDPTETITILKRLYSFSILGFYRAGGSGYGGSEYVFKYKDPQAQFDEGAQRFKVHWSLIDVLGLKKFSKTPLAT